MSNTIPFHFKNDTDGQAEGAEEVICISNFVNWYKFKGRQKDGAFKLF